MTAPSIGCKDLLVTALVGQYSASGSNLGAWPIFISKMPESPDSCIAIYDGGGLASNPRWLLDYPDVSILVRAQDYLDSYNKAKDIRSVLCGLNSQTINGDRWDQVTMIGGITNAGRDQMDRCINSMTFRLIVEPAPTSLDTRPPLA